MEELRQRGARTPAQALLIPEAVPILPSQCGSRAAKWARSRPPCLPGGPAEVVLVATKRLGGSGRLCETVGQGGEGGSLTEGARMGGTCPGRVALRLGRCREDPSRLVPTWGLFLSCGEQREGAGPQCTAHPPPPAPQTTQGPAPGAAGRVEKNQLHSPPHLTTPKSRVTLLGSARFHQPR